VVSMSSRPTGTTRAGWSTRSTTVGRPPGSRAVVTTASDPAGRRTVVELVDLPLRVVPVGRLDTDTSGALLLTNDGELAHRLAHPRYEVDKVYEVTCARPVADAQLELLRRGVELDDGPTAPAAARRLGPGVIELVLHEGRNRQVRRMLEAVGNSVVALHRSRYGPLTLEGLEPGAWRELEASEVEQLRSLPTA